MWQLFENTYYKWNTILYTTVTNPFLLHVTMWEPNQTQEMKSHAVIISLAAGHSDLKIIVFLEVVRSFVFKLKRELEDARSNVVAVCHNKLHCWWSDIIRMLEFASHVQSTIDEDPRKYMRAFAREPQVDEATVQCMVHEDLHYKSY